MAMQWKEVEPFVGLLVLTAVLVYAYGWLTGGKQGGPGKKMERLDGAALVRRKRFVFAASVGTMLGFLALGMLAYLFRLPAALEDTHRLVAEHKQAARERCHALMEQDDLIGAEMAIRDNELSKELAADFAARGRMTIDRALRPATNFIFFRSGAFTAALPLFVVLVVQLVLLRLGREPDWLPTHADWAFVLLPAQYAALGTTWVSTMAFHFWLRERQFTSCMLISGHWYTAGHTAFALTLLLIFLRAECSEGPGPRRWTKPGSPLPLYYSAYFALYLALTFGALSSSQRFHHDWQESVAGITSMLRILFFSGSAGMVGLVVGLEKGYLFREDPEFENTDQDVLREVGDLAAKTEPALQRRIKCGQVCKVLQSFVAESEVELSVEKGAIVRVVGEPDDWIDVEDTDGRVGFVPMSFLAPTTDTFALNVERIKAQTVARAEAERANPSAKTSPTEEAASVAKEAAAATPEPPSRAMPSRPVPAFLQEIKKGARKLSATPKGPPEPVAGESASGGGLFDELKNKLKQNREQIDPAEEADQDDDAWQED